jgi:hypothetical protein
MSDAAYPNKRLALILRAVVLTLLFLLIPASARTSDQSLSWPSGVSSHTISDLLLQPNDPWESYTDPHLEPGFPVLTAHLPGSYMTGPIISTLVGNIDSDPQLEIIVSGLASGPLYALNHDGSLLANWPLEIYDRAYYPTLGHLLPGAERYQLFTSQMMHRSADIPAPYMLAFTYDLQLLPGWPRLAAYDTYGPPSLADFNGDGLDEIFIYEGWGEIHAYLADGSLLPGWPVLTGDFYQSIGDLDRDGDLELITAADWENEGPVLGAYHHTGQRVENFAVPFIPYMHTSPVSGDIDGDGETEVVMFSFEPGNFLYLYFLSHTGQIERKISINDAGLGVPNQAISLADLTGDQIPEIVVAFDYGIAVWDGFGSMLPGFPVVWHDKEWGTYTVSQGAPVIGDVDGDQQPDIVVIALPQMKENPYLFAYSSQGQLLANFPKFMPMIGVGGTPALADIDLDGRNEIIVIGDYWDGGARDLPKVFVFDMGGPPHGRIEWGQYGGGPKHWHMYPPPPDYPGANVFVTSVKTMAVNRSGTAVIPIQIGNYGVAPAPSVVLTATLPTHFQYQADNLGVSPVLEGNKVIWQLADFPYLKKQWVFLEVQLPPGINGWDKFNVTFNISSDAPDAVTADSQHTIQLRAVLQVFLPQMHRERAQP